MELSRKKKTKWIWIIGALMLTMFCCGMLASCGGSGGSSDGTAAESAQEETKATVKAGDLVDQKTEAAAKESTKADQKTDAAENADGDAGEAGADGQHAAGGDAGEGNGGGSSSGGNSSSGNNGGKPAAAKVCYVSVDDYCSDMEVSWSSGDTAYSVLKKTGAKVSARSTQYGMYVEGINGLFEFDKGGESGWMYSVDGEVPNKSADKCKVGKGAHVQWYYVTGQ